VELRLGLGDGSDPPLEWCVLDLLAILDDRRTADGDARGELLVKLRQLDLQCSRCVPRRLLGRVVGAVADRVLLDRDVRRLDVGIGVGGARAKGLRCGQLRDGLDLEVHEQVSC